jgi:hypothetical protein
MVAGLVILAGAAQAAGQTLCKPTLAVTNVRFSEMQPPAMERTWTAHIVADASRCTNTSGQFQMHFTRLKEVGPDLPFTEQFTWREGDVEIASQFWADESVLDYAIAYVAPCTCRK